MNVTSICPQQKYWISNAAYKKTALIEKPSSANVESVANAKDQKVSESNSSTIWEELSKKYNVRKATFDDIKAISRALYDAGEISLRDLSTLTFDFARATNDLKLHAPVPIPDRFDMYETKANSREERDWILEFEARAQKDLKYGIMKSYHSKMKCIEILQRLDNIKNI